MTKDEIDLRKVALSYIFGYSAYNSMNFKDKLKYALEIYNFLTEDEKDKSKENKKDENVIIPTGIIFSKGSKLYDHNGREIQLITEAKALYL